MAVLQDAPGAADGLTQLRRYVNNRVVETAGAANFTTNYDDQNYLLLGSDRRTDAILLDALIGDNPQSDLIPKLVNGLLAHRTRGRWDNTQENVFVLLAPGPLLQHLRNPDAGLRRPHLAGANLRGRPGIRRAHDRPRARPICR